MEKNTKQGKDEKGNLPGYPPYPADQDIYSQEEARQDMDPEAPGERKKTDADEEQSDEAEALGSRMGGDLDVPGGELDDEDESIGEEDEENNYYSLGGDDENDLDEDNMLEE